MMGGVRPVLSEASVTGDRIVEARQVSDRPDMRVAALEMLVDDDRPSVECDVGSSEVRGSGLDPYADDRELRLDRHSGSRDSALEPAAGAVKLRHRVSEDDVDPAFPVERRERGGDIGMPER